ncbi:Fis family transcriptional regulator [Desulfonema ishimotonii]|uniref:Fis family transcriptional regulator n=2 Tax=Desulfonema ishimotonii TaxID=45657 RepID=A0A401G3D6_9BACT|nr:Fis family transcriptional regulator [Desulfonema ishimotonii]
MDEKNFFREVTLRICGSLEIEKALWECLLYIRQFIPASHMAFHVYHRDLGIIETVAHATTETGKALSIRTPISPKARRQIEEQRSVRVRLIDRLGDNAVTRPVARQLGALNLSAIVMDLVLERTFLGILSVLNDGENKFDDIHIRLMRCLNEPFAIALTNSLRFRELSHLRDLLADDNRYLQDELRKMAGEEIIGADFGLRGVMELVRQVAHLDSPVLLLGETGTGKEVVANAIHNLSLRKDGPFIKVNCGAIPENLMDSELFGHEKGAFTGAFSRKRGLFERAHGGTLFLDEIGELPPEAQVRLLRVLQEKEIDRVGGSNPIRVDIRVIAATHRDLEAMLTQRRFREDLYFRLRVFPISIPPLRERIADLPALVQHFIQKKSRDMKLDRLPMLAPAAIDRLMAYPWPGNVRELENAVERALILSRGKPLTFSDIRPRACEQAPAIQPELKQTESPALDIVMARHIRRVLDMCGGRVEGPRGAALILDINPSTLRKRMKKLGIPFGRKAR